jgi:hypothetical protein
MRSAGWHRDGTPPGKTVGVSGSEKNSELPGPLPPHHREKQVADACRRDQPWCGPSNTPLHPSVNATNFGMASSRQPSCRRHNDPPSPPTGGRC